MNWGSGSCIFSGANSFKHLQVFAFPLAEVERGNAGGIFDEADDREFPLLDGFDFQPGFVPLRSIWRVRPLGDDAFPVQLGGVLKHLLTVAGEMFGIENRQFDVVFAEKVQQRLLALDLREACEGRHSRQRRSKA